jgi:opacity protein-like surface antigen
MRKHDRSGRFEFTVAAVCLAVLLASPALAGIGKGNGEIGFDFGVTDFDSNVSDDDAGRFVIRGGYFLTDLFEIEAHYAVSVTDEVFGDATLTTFFGDATFNFRPSENIVPYALVGVGWAELDFDLVLFVGNIDDSALAYQAGGGSRFFFGKTKRVAVRVELTAISEDTFDESSTHINLVAGFTWRLGK